MKRALLVGINNYKSDRIQDLNGCVNDVLNIRSLLKESFGFEDAGIHVVTDERATAANIKDRLQQMIYKSQDGDTLVFHFSGHGSQIRDRNGDELADGLDELLCPYDMDWDRRESFITDDDLSEILAEGGKDLSNGQVFEIFLDCCHSGTGIRQMTGFNPSRQNRYTAPPIDILCRSMDVVELPIERLFLRNQDLSDPILWSGCRANQTSADAHIEGGYNGAFTWHLCDAIRKGATARGKLIQTLRSNLTNGGFGQVPQLETRHEGKLTSRIFS